jgi:hypothetical protein
MRIRFLKFADREVDDAVIWYDNQVEGLGREFLDELDRSVRLVRAYPEASTEIEPGSGDGSWPGFLIHWCTESITTR